MSAKTSDPVQEQFTRARRNQILDAATKVFAEKGFHRATIRDIAGAAGIADGTIYNYFDNKIALLLGILDRLNQTDQREMDFQQGTQMDIRLFLRTYLRQRYAHITQQGFEIFQIVLSEVLVNQELRDLYYQQVVAPTFAGTEKYLRIWIDQGVIKPLDIALRMRIIAGATLGVLILRIMGDTELTERWDDIPDLLADFVLDSIEMRKGDDS